MQTQAEKFLPKAETLNRGRKRKAQTSKQKSSSVRWVGETFIPIKALQVYLILGLDILCTALPKKPINRSRVFMFLQKSSAAEAVDAGNDSDCLSSASSVSDSEDEEDKTTNNPEKNQVICE